MLKIKTNVIGFDYDIHSLVKAFYPEEEVRVYSEEECDNPDAIFDFRGPDPNEDRPVYKNEFKIKLYEQLSKETEKILPWGTLTGIRPTKLPMEMIQKGKSDEEIRERLKNTYLVSDEKIELSIEIAKREIFALRDIDAKEGYSLYIGIPFCPTTCLYCSFTSYPIVTMKKVVKDYLNALDKEIDYVAKEFAGKTLDTVYIGGGTPTTLEAVELDRLLTKIEESLDLSHIKEFTVEAGRADSITEEKLETLKKHGVTRISVNPQTMNEETLRFIGRKATAAQTVEAYKLARSLGFDNINMDIILGLPGEGARDVKRTMEIIGELKPDNLTVHSLAIKRASALSRFIEENGMSMINNTDETMAIASEGAAAMGLKPYYLYRQKNMSGNFENVGYASEGKYGIYNILIMEELQSIVALGAGTVTKRVYGNGRIERCDNVKDVKLYIEKIEEMIDRKRKLFEGE